MQIINILQKISYAYFKYFLLVYLCVKIKDHFFGEMLKRGFFQDIKNKILPDKIGHNMYYRQNKILVYRRDYNLVYSPG